MEEFLEDNKAYIAGDNYGPVVKPVTLPAGVSLAKGTILGKITATGQFAAYAAANVDGTGTARCVLAEEIVGGAAPINTVGWYAGVYVKDNMVGLDAAAEDALEVRGLYFV